MSTSLQICIQPCATLHATFFDETQVSSIMASSWAHLRDSKNFLLRANFRPASCSNRGVVKIHDARLKGASARRAADQSGPTVALWPDARRRGPNAFDDFGPRDSAMGLGTTLRPRPVPARRHCLAASCVQRQLAHWNAPRRPLFKVCITSLLGVVREPEF